MTERAAGACPERICAGSGWYGSRVHNPENYSPHLHCPCGAPCLVCDPDGSLAQLDFPLTCQNPNCRFDDAPAAHLVTTRQPCGHNDELLACASCYIDATYHPVLEVTCAECGLTYIAQTADLFTTQPIPTTTRSNP